MGLSVRSAAILGLQASEIEIQVDVRRGTFFFNIVGLPDGAIRESKDRVTAAIYSSGYYIPERHITINLAPSDVRKEGSSFDLPIAVGILAGVGLIDRTDRLRAYAIAGELSLDGGVRGIRGALAIALEVRRLGLEGLIIPQENAAEAAVVSGLRVIPVTHLSEVVQFLRGEIEIKNISVDPAAQLAAGAEETDLDFSQVAGQEHAKRAMEIAAAGGHNLLLVGPPGSGKTMLAKRMTTILPDLTLEEALEVTKIHSIAGRLPSNAALVTRRPFESPHHTISYAGLAGGGAMPRPGMISLAHHGVLFLDELPEFGRNVLEVLRQPLEDGQVKIVRAQADVTFPAAFSLVAAMNPCPCGYFGDPTHACTCTPAIVSRYLQRISGPLMDRIDLHVEVPSIRYREIAAPRSGEKSSDIRRRVVTSRIRQATRFIGTSATCNAGMTGTQLRKFCVLDADGHRIMESVMDRLGLSARAHDRILKVARTIADLDGSEALRPAHIAEAVQYRGLDRLLAVRAA